MIKPAHTHSTSRDPDAGRIRVEDVGVSESRFNSGKSYRLDYVIDIPEDTGPLYLKFDIQAPIDLTLSEVALVQGGVHYEVFTASQITETTSFDTVDNRIFPRNSRVTPDPKVQLLSGGTFTVNANEEANTNLFVKTANFGFSRENAVSSEQSKRGFPVTTAYVRITELTSNTTDTVGTLKLEYEVAE